MLHPSYSELIEHVNHANEQLDLPPITSRYTLVMAVAKRARRLVEGAPLMVEDTVGGRMLSQAVHEMEAEKIGVVIEEPAEESGVNLLDRQSFSGGSFSFPDMDDDISSREGTEDDIGEVRDDIPSEPEDGAREPEDGDSPEEDNE